MDSGFPDSLATCGKRKGPLFLGRMAGFVLYDFVIVCGVGED